MIIGSFNFVLFTGLKVLFFISARHLGWQLTVYKLQFPLIAGDNKLTKARNLIDVWFRQNGNLMLPFLAFAIPLIVRAIPEILMGQYLVGFDNVGYYVPNTLTWLGNGVSFWSLMSSAPLFYILLMGTTSLGAPIVVTLKILGPLLLGLLGFVAYNYAHKALSWSSKKSLVLTILSTLYFVALRISWDMFRSELALVFLFLMLILLQKNGNTLRNGFFLSLTMIFVVLSHQLIAIIMFVIIISTIASFYFKKKKAELKRILISSIPAVLLFGLIIYINYFIFSSPIMDYSVNYAGGFESLAATSHPELVIDTLGFLVICYLPLVPLLIFGFRRSKNNIQLKAWILWILLPLLIVIISPTTFFLGGVLPYRWILLLTYPLSFYAVEGLFAIKWNWYKIVYKIVVGFIIAFLSVGFLILPNSGALDYFGSYPTYIPKSMLQNTVQLSDCQDTANALLWTKNNMPGNGYLLVHEAFYGWATLSFNNSRLIPYFFGNPSDAVDNLQQRNNSNPLYLIWWINGTGWYGQSTVPAMFKELFQSGNIAIYQYSVNS